MPLPAAIAPGTEVQLPGAIFHQAEDGTITEIEQEAPSGADDAVNLLIKRLMPVIKAGFEQISSVGQAAPQAQSEPSPSDACPCRNGRTARLHSQIYSTRES